MELTLGGLVGAVAGAILGGVNYAMLIGYLDGWLKSAEGAEAERGFRTERLGHAPRDPWVRYRDLRGDRLLVGYELFESGDRGGIGRLR